MTTLLRGLSTGRNRNIYMNSCPQLKGSSSESAGDSGFFVFVRNCENKLLMESMRNGTLMVSQTLVLVVQLECGQLIHPDVEIIPGKHDCTCSSHERVLRHSASLTTHVFKTQTGTVANDFASSLERNQVKWLYDSTFTDMRWKVLYEVLGVF